MIVGDYQHEHNMLLVATVQAAEVSVMIDLCVLFGRYGQLLRACISACCCSFICTASDARRTLSSRFGACRIKPSSS